MVGKTISLFLVEVFNIYMNGNQSSKSHTFIDLEGPSDMESTCQFYSWRRSSEQSQMTSLRSTGRQVVEPMHEPAALIQVRGSHSRWAGQTALMWTWVPIWNFLKRSEWPTFQFLNEGRGSAPTQYLELWEYVLPSACLKPHCHLLTWF